MKFNSNQVLISLLLLLFKSEISKAWSQYPLYENSWYDYRVPEAQYPNKSPLSNNLGNPEEFRQHVFEVCRYTFSGAWNLITADKMRFFELRRSLSDRWYYCGLPFDIKPLYREYGEAAVIFYGPERRNSDDSTTAAMISAYFSQKQAQQRSTLLTPRILGTFPGGRVEEYWQDARMSKNSEMPLHAEVITRKLAYIHGLNPPAPRSPDHFWHQIASLLTSARTACINPKARAHLQPQQAVLSEILGINLEAEAIWLRSFLEDLRAPIVFSHGSLREEEIYYRKYRREDNKITFLNLGWGRYMYRSYDLADYFIEWGIKYDKRLNYPHFVITGDYPDHQRIEELLILYLQSMTAMEREWPAANNTVEGLLEEITRATLLSHFFYGVQALFSSFYDFGKIFGFPEYAKARLDIYFELKQTLIEKHRLNIPLFATVNHFGEVIDKGYPGSHVMALNGKQALDPVFNAITSRGYDNGKSTANFSPLSNSMLRNLLDKQMEMCKTQCYNILSKTESLSQLNETKRTNVLLNSNPNYYSKNQFGFPLHHSFDNMRQKLDSKQPMAENLIQNKFTESQILSALTGQIRNDHIFQNQDYIIHKHNPMTGSSSQLIFNNPNQQTLNSIEIMQQNHHVINSPIPQNSPIQLHQNLFTNIKPLSISSSHNVQQYHHFINNPINNMPQTVSSRLNIQQHQKNFNNTIHTLPQTVSSSHNVQQHDKFLNNPIRTLPQTVSSKHILHERHLFDNQIHHIPQDVSSRHYKEEHHQLVNNPIQAMPQTASSSHNLHEHGHLIHNHIHTLPQAVSSSHNVQPQPHQLVNKLIHTLPRTVSSSPYVLQHHESVNSPILAMPKTVSSSHNLHEHRHLIDNPIHTLPQTVSSSHNVQQQPHQLVNNPIHTFPQTVSSSPYVLKHHPLVNNPVHTFSQTASSSHNVQPQHQLVNNLIVSPIQLSQNQHLFNNLNPGSQRVNENIKHQSIKQPVINYPFSSLSDEIQAYNQMNNYPTPQTLSSSHNLQQNLHFISKPISHFQSSSHQTHNVFKVPQTINSNQQSIQQNILKRPITQSLISSQIVQKEYSVNSPVPHSMISSQLSQHQSHNPIPQSMSSNNNMQYKHNPIPQSQFIRNSHFMPNTVSSSHSKQPNHHVILNPQSTIVNHNVQQNHHLIPNQIHKIFNSNQNIDLRHINVLNKPIPQTVNTNQRLLSGHLFNNQFPQTITQSHQTQQPNAINNPMPKSMSSMSGSQNEFISKYSPQTTSPNFQLEQLHHQMVNNPIIDNSRLKDDNPHKYDSIANNLQNIKFAHEANQVYQIPNNSIHQIMSSNSQTQQNHNFFFSHVPQTSYSSTQITQKASTHLVPQTLIFGDQTQHQLITNNLRHNHNSNIRVLPTQQSVSHSLLKSNSITSFWPQTETMRSFSQSMIFPKTSQQNHILRNSLLTENNKIQSIPNSFLENEDKMLNNINMNSNSHSKALRSLKSVKSHETLDDITNSESNDYYIGSKLGGSHEPVDDDDQILIDPDYDASYRGQVVIKKPKLADRPASEVV